MSHPRAWIDVLTPKQVLFFAPVVSSLEKDGVEVLATSRRYREVGPLAERAGLALKYVGERGEKGREDQLVASTARQQELIPIIKEFAPTCAVSVASGVCARISFGLGVKHVAVNDSPHSEVAGRLSLPLSYHLLCPWVIPYGAWSKFGIARKQITRYRALDPAAWLKRERVHGPVPDIDPEKKTITVRVQETDAPYLSEADEDWSDVVLGRLLDAFPDANLVALCRYDYQVRAIRSKFGSRCIVPDEVVSGADLLASTDLFVGMGGTMSAEAALMGVPTISAFQGSLYTDAYLKSVGLIARATKAPAVISLAKRYLSGQFGKRFSKKAKRILDSMDDPVPIIAGFVRKTAEQG